MTIKEAYLTTADKVLPVTYKRHWEDGFLYEEPRPTHNVVMVVYEDGRREYKKGEQDMITRLLAGDLRDLSEGYWAKHSPVYGSEAWESLVMEYVQGLRWPQ